MSYGGGQEWSISPKDLSLQKISATTCIGAFFILDSPGGPTAPAWIVGDTFLVSDSAPSHLFSGRLLVITVYDLCHTEKRDERLPI